MPVYTYECEECKERTEELQRISDPVPETCPKCKQKGTLRRAMSLSNFQLKGSGWAKDGYG